MDLNRQYYYECAISMVHSAHFVHRFRLVRVAYLHIIVFVQRYMYMFFFSENVRKKGFPVSVELLIWRFSELVQADCLRHNNCEPNMCHYIEWRVALFKLNFKVTTGKSCTIIDVPPIWNSLQRRSPIPNSGVWIFFPVIFVLFTFHTAISQDFSIRQHRSLFELFVQPCPLYIFITWGHIMFNNKSDLLDIYIHISAVFIIYE